MTNKKYIGEMTKEELVKVLHANEKLQGDVQDDMVDTEMFYIEEQLDYLKPALSNWSIGVYNRNYINVHDADKFIALLGDVEKDIPILVDSDTPKIEKALELRDKYRDTDVYSEEFDELEEQLEDVADDLADLVAYCFTQRLNGCSDEDAMEDYFLSFYVDHRMEDNEAYIIEGDNDYILREDVSYTKTYK